MTPYVEMKLMAEAGERRRIGMQSEANRLAQECDALHDRLNLVEEENDRLRTLLENALAEILLIVEVVGSTRQILQLVSDMRSTLENRS